MSALNSGVSGAHSCAVCREIVVQPALEGIEIRHQLANAGDECRIGLLISIDEDLHHPVPHPEVANPRPPP